MVTKENNHMKRKIRRKKWQRKIHRLCMSTGSGFAIFRGTKTTTTTNKNYDERRQKFFFVKKIERKKRHKKKTSPKHWIGCCLSLSICLSAGAGFSHNIRICLLAWQKFMLLAYLIFESIQYRHWYIGVVIGRVLVARKYIWYYR